MLSAALLACVLVQGQPHDVARSPHIRVGINFDLGFVLCTHDDCAPAPVYVQRQVVVQQPVCVVPAQVAERVVYVNRPVYVERPVVYAERCEPRVYVSHPIYADACERRAYAPCPVEVRHQVVVERRDECRDGRRW